MTTFFPCINCNDEASVLHAVDTLKNQFILALESDADTLFGFVNSWTKFSKFIDQNANSFQRSTLDVVFTFASVVGEISSNMLELQTASNDLSLQFETDIAKILNDGMHNLQVDDNHRVLHIAPAHEWLKNNLHNPYPSKEVRSAISSEAHCHVKDVDNWFVDARRRIGWNSLRKSRFGNKRSTIVNAATRFFVQIDPKNPLTPGMESDFVRIKSLASDLYFEKPIKSGVAKYMVEDLVRVPCIKVPSREEVARRPKMRNKMKRSRAHVDAYPSPAQTPERSLDRSSNLETDSVLDDGRYISSLKRRISSFEDEEISTGVPNKRGRLDDGSTVTHDPLPSPSATEFELTNINQQVMPLPTPPFSPSILPGGEINALSKKRKRRLSDSDCQGFPKRRCDIPSGPRLQSASDPISVSSRPTLYEFDSRTAVEDLDLSAVVDCDVYDWTQICHDHQLASPISDESSTFLTFPPWSSEISATITPTALTTFCDNDFSFNDQLCYDKFINFQPGDILSTLYPTFSESLELLSSPAEHQVHLISSEIISHDDLHSLPCPAQGIFTSPGLILSPPLEPIATPIQLLESNWNCSDSSRSTSELWSGANLCISEQASPKILNTPSKADIEAELQKLNILRLALEAKLQQNSS